MTRPVSSQGRSRGSGRFRWTTPATALLRCLSSRGSSRWPSGGSGGSRKSGRRGWRLARQARNSRCNDREMHEITGLREPANSTGSRFDDTAERRLANRAVGVSAAGLAATGLVELAVAVITGSVGLLVDALHDLSDVSTSAMVFLGFRISKR